MYQINNMNIFKIYILIQTRKNIRVNLTRELYGEDLSGLDIAEFLFIKLKQLM